MPVFRKYSTQNNKKVGYFQFGSHKKYYYTIGNKTSRQNAYDKAKKQQAAAYASGYRGK